MRILATQMTLGSNSFEFYVSGCNPPHCKDCFNPETWDFNLGEIVDENFKHNIKTKLTDFEILFDKFFILGGEPLHQDHNQLIEFLTWLKNTYPEKELWLFTRYNKVEVPDDIFQLCDYIKCGCFIPELKCENNKQYGITLGSSNQIIYKNKKG